MTHLNLMQRFHEDSKVDGGPAKLRQAIETLMPKGERVPGLLAAIACYLNLEIYESGAGEQYDATLNALAGFCEKLAEKAGKPKHPDHLSVMDAHVHPEAGVCGLHLSTSLARIPAKHRTMALTLACAAMADSEGMPNADGVAQEIADVFNRRLGAPDATVDAS